MHRTRNMQTKAVYTKLCQTGFESYEATVSPAGLNPVCYHLRLVLGSNPKQAFSLSRSTLDGTLSNSIAMRSRTALGILGAYSTTIGVSDFLCYRYTKRKIGGRDRTRTRCLLNANQTLSQLSYTPQINCGRYGIGQHDRHPMFLLQMISLLSRP